MTDYTLTVDTASVSVTANDIEHRYFNHSISTASVAITANDVGLTKQWKHPVTTANITVTTFATTLQKFITAYFNHQIELTAYFDD